MELAFEEKQRPDVDLKLKALSNRFRRFLLGLVYANGKMHPSDIAKHVQTDSNFIAYHLNILIEANLLEKSYERHGNQLSEYMVTEDGKKFLDFIGATEKLKEISAAEGNIPGEETRNTVKAIVEQNTNKIRYAKARRGSYGRGRKKYARAKSKLGYLKRKKTSRKLKI
jgi:predicted transcriptional regulator